MRLPKLNCSAAVSLRQARAHNESASHFECCKHFFDTLFARVAFYRPNQLLPLFHNFHSCRENQYIYP
jgi:hypothetical protein